MKRSINSMGGSGGGGSSFGGGSTSGGDSGGLSIGSIGTDEMDMSFVDNSRGRHLATGRLASSGFDGIGLPDYSQQGNNNYNNNHNNHNHINKNNNIKNNSSISGSISSIQSYNNSNNRAVPKSNSATEIAANLPGMELGEIISPLQNP